MKNYCSLCGDILTQFDESSDLTIRKKIGFGSKHDGDTIEIRICCNCADMLIDNAKTFKIANSIRNLREED